MKKLFTILISLCLMIGSIMAQTPNSFKYQAVVRDNAGQIIVSKNVGFRISILQASASGFVVYAEKHVVQTNAFGLVNLEIGNGTIVSGSLATINWGSNSYFVKIELDASNSGSYSDMGTSQLLAVPYSLYAKEAGNGFSGNYNDLSNKPDLSTVANTGVYTDLLNKPTLAPVATTGNYTDLSGKPTLAPVATSGKYSDLSGQPTLAPVATSGKYSDLSGQPTLAPVATSGKYSDLLGQPAFAKVATTGNYTDLLGQPTLAKIATTGNYSDLLGKPTLATVATTGSYSDLLSKPALATIATTGSFTDLLNVPILVKLLKNPQAGDIIYNNGTNWELLTRGTNGQTLRLDNGVPKWGEPGYALPMVTTNAITDILQTAATSGGNVIATGFTNSTARGVCWSTNQNPTTADSKTTETAGIGTYTSQLTNLIANTTYYARAYATNAAGTAYGNQVSFKTFLTVAFPTVTTAAAINISENAAASGGNVTATGGAEVTAKGICWGTNQNPTIADNKTNDGNGTGQFTSQMKNLLPGTTYYVRAYADNSAGTGYGNQVPLTTLKTIPTVTTKNITSISTMGGVSGGTITISGGGTISDKGICWGESENPTINDNKISAGTGIAAFNSAINMLKPNTTCYVRAYAVNEIGIAYGTQKTFTTSDAFYEGFETGFSGTTGGWGIVIGDAVEGAYSLKTNISNSEVSLKRTLTNAGQITFYVKNTVATWHVNFYIDDVVQGSYSNGFWGQQSYPVSKGEHTFKWKYIIYGTNGLYDAWIDFIVIPK